MSPPGTPEGSDPWVLPLGYVQMTRLEQAEVLEACIERFLEARGRATASEIQRAIQAPKIQTLKKHLDRLAAIQQIYSDRIGSEDVYFRNGTLAHHTLQRTIKAGMTEYDLRVYKDPLTGRSLTITEYNVSPLRERSPKSGIRVDLADLDALITELHEVRDLIREHPERLSADLKSVRKDEV